MATSRRKPVKKIDIEAPQVCAKCGDKGDFYSSKSMMHTKWEKMCYCKNCIVELFQDLHKKLDDKEKAMIELCKYTNIPYRIECFNSAKQKFDEDGVDMVKTYFSIFSRTRSNPEDTFSDGDIFQSEEEETNPDDTEVKVKNFKGREELENMFGFGFEKEEYIAMKKKYDFLKNNYYGKTNIHKESLTTYVRYKVREELATAKGDAKEANTWGKLAEGAATNAKINPSQLSARDLQGGAGSFSEISKMIEEAIDIIPMLPQFKSQPIDAADFIIWVVINYLRDLDGLPLCGYEDIYKFYDETVDAYIKQYGDPYGIFTNDPTKKNREKIKSFISTEAEEEIDANKDFFESGDDI